MFLRIVFASTREVLVLATELLVLLDVLYFEVVAFVLDEFTELLRLKLFEDVLLRVLPE